MLFGEYLKTLRESTGLMQRELAERVGISASMLSRLESGDREPTVRMLSDLAHAMKVPPYSLFAAAIADVEGSDSNAHLKAMTASLQRATQHVASITKLRHHRGAD